MSKKIKFTIIIIFILVLSGCNKFDNLLSIHVIDIGQGDCILIKTPEKKNILIDGGDEDSYKIINSYLKYHKVKNLDMIIATHFDKDHIGSLDSVIDNFNVNKVYTPNQRDNSKHYYNLINSCKNKNIKIRNLQSGDKLNIDKNISMHILNPSYIQDNSNANSIAFNLKFKDMDFLFTGDCEEEIENRIISSYNLETVDFLKVAHHGSSSSSSEEFIKKTSPLIATISCGYKNNYGHPHKSTLDTLKKYNVKTFRTDFNGDLVFYSDGSKIFTTKKYKLN
ncbi:ComEC/Rec2 family competence protein [Terrisporobacter sp.]